MRFSEDATKTEEKEKPEEGERIIFAPPEQKLRTIGRRNQDDQEIFKKPAEEESKHLPVSNRSS